MESNWLITNDVKEIITCLKTIKRELPYVLEDVNTWKIILMLQHNAVQATMVRGLRQGNTLNVLTKKSRKAYEEMLESNDNRDMVKLHLLSFKDLYKNICNPSYLRMPFQRSDITNKVIERLNEFRNEFTHFAVSGWSIHASIFPEIIRETNRIIDHFMSNLGYMFLIDENDRKQILILIHEINEINDEIEKVNFEKYGFFE